MRLPLLVLTFSLAVACHAQSSDSLRISVGTMATAATKSYQPLWLLANRYGSIANRQADLATYVTLHNEHQQARATQLGTPRKTWFVGYGAALYNNRRFGNTFLQEGYLKGGYGAWQLRAGRYRETTGELDPNLSSGSFGISSNALPLPKIEVAVIEYTAVPFTQGWVQFKGNFAHGWFGTQYYSDNASQKAIKNVFLHQKSLYLQFGKERLSVYGSLTHFAQWGGTFASGHAPSRFKDYLRIIAGASGDAADPVYQQGPIDVDNAVGNHLLIPDFGFTIQHHTSTFRAYTQTIFDKGVGDSSNPNKRDKLVGLKILGRDRLVGLSWETSNQSVFQKIVLEGIYTKYQGGPIIYNGQDNYYNNGTYRTGWQYNNRIIGTPLFINLENARNYQLPLSPSILGGWNTVSNRVAGVHLGLRGTVVPRLRYRALATYVQHFGNYNNDPYFTPAKKQVHLLCELPYQFRHGSITAAVAHDAGDLSNNTAGLLRLEWLVR